MVQCYLIYKVKFKNIACSFQLYIIIIVLKNRHWRGDFSSASPMYQEKKARSVQELENKYVIELNSPYLILVRSGLCIAYNAVFYSNSFVGSVLLVCMINRP